MVGEIGWQSWVQGKFPLVGACQGRGALDKHIFTSISISGTSIRTPTTVASAAPEESPNSITAVAIATSKWFEAPINAAGAAYS